MADGSLLRLIGKCLHVGVMYGAELTEPSEGTAQGSTLSPLLGNVYLHTVLDRWFAEGVRPRLRGKATFIRYVDDGVFGFERQDDAQRVRAVLSKRLEHFELTLHPEKTRLLDFRRPPRSRGEGRSPTSFEFLGFCRALAASPYRGIGGWRARPGVRGWRGPYRKCMHCVAIIDICRSSSGTRSS